MVKPSSGIGAAQLPKTDRTTPSGAPAQSAAPKTDASKGKPEPIPAKPTPPPPPSRSLSPGQRAFFGPSDAAPVKAADDKHTPPPPSFVRFIVDSAGRIRPTEENVRATPPQSLTRHLLDEMKQWSIDVSSSKIIAKGMAALERLEKIARMAPEKVAALGKKARDQIDADLKLFDMAAQKVADRGTDGGLHPEKSLEYHVTHTHQAIRSGADHITIEGSIVGIDMTAINAADHSYRSGDAVRDAVTKAANIIFGHDIGARKNSGIHDNITRLKNTTVMLCGVGEQELAQKWPAFKQQVTTELKALVKERRLPLQDFSGFDLLYTYTAKTSIAAADATPGALETKIGLHIAELSAGEGAAGAARKSTTPQKVPVYKGLLTETAITEAAKDSFYLFHSPETSPNHDIRHIPTLDQGGAERPDFKITPEDIQSGRVMRRGHRFGFLAGLSSTLREFVGKARTGAIGDATAAQARATAMLAATHAGEVNAGVDLSRYNYRFSDGKTGMMLKPQYLGEEIFRQAQALRASAGPNAEIEFHVFFTELRKAGDYFSTYKSDLKDSNYRMTLDIPFKGLAQAGLGGGTQSVVGGDEVVWIRMEVKGQRGDPKFSPDRIQHVVDGIQKQFERVHKKRPFQPSEKVPFEGGKYLLADGKTSVRFGIKRNGTVVLERPKGIGKKAFKTIAGDPGFTSFVAKHFGSKAAAALANPKQVRVVTDLSTQGSVSRHKVWVDRTVKHAEVYRPRGKKPPHLVPRKQIFGMDVAHGKTSDARDIFRLIAKLGGAVSGAKTNGGKLVSGVKIGFLDKAQTRGEYRLAGGALSWLIGDVVSTVVVGGVQALVTGNTRELKKLGDPKAYVDMATGFAEITGIARGVDFGAKAFLTKPGVPLTGVRAHGVQGAAILATILLPMALRGQLDAEQAFHAVTSVGAAMVASSVVMKGLHGAKLLTAESGWGIVASAVIEFGVIKGYQSVQEHRAITHQHDQLRSSLTRRMRALDQSIVALERSGPDRSKAEDRVAKSYAAFQQSYQDYVSFVALYQMPEGEGMQEAIKKRDDAIAILENYQTASSSEVVQRNDAGDVLQVGLPNDGFETTLPPATEAMTQRFQKAIDLAQRDMDKTGEALHTTWTQRIADTTRALPEKTLTVDIGLCNAAEPETPEAVVITGPGEKTVTYRPAKEEHAYNTQLSGDPFVFQGQLLRFIDDRTLRIANEVPEDKLRSAMKPK